MKKLGIFLLNTVGVLILAFVVAWTGLVVAKCVLYRDYMKNGMDECTIPDLHRDFVPQGLTHADDNTFIFSGYHGKTGALCLYISENGTSKKLIPLDTDGKEWEGHGGGVACVGDYVYVASEAKLIIFKLSDMRNANSGEQLTCIGTFPVDTEASFCYTDGQFLYVGEFYRPVDYPIDDSHRFVTPAGDEHQALVSVYPLMPTGEIADTYPLYSISIPAQVQGFAVKGNTYMVSRSWGVTTSKLEFYNGIIDTGSTIDVSGKAVPLFYLDASNLEKTLDMPAFSEDLTVIGDRVYVSFESACNKYIIGKLFFADQVVSYPIPTFGEK